MSKRIPLTQGKFAIVDDADYDSVSRFNWYAERHKRRWYARRQMDGKKQRLHQFILSGVKSIDHRDGDGLNNTRQNLRPASRSQNGANQKKIRGSSRFKGVFWHLKKWQVSIHADQKSIYLGRFDKETTAAKAYDAAAKFYFGEFARLNFPWVS
jgi:hypothetical protein